MDDPKCAKTHLSITETSNICKFMLVALTYCKFMSRRCQSALLSYKQRSLHTKIVFHNFPLSLSHCMHSYLWMFFHVVGPSLAFTHCHSSYTMSCRFKLINNLWTSKVLTYCLYMPNRTSIDQESLYVPARLFAPSVRRLKGQKHSALFMIASHSPMGRDHVQSGFFINGPSIQISWCNFQHLL